MALPYTSEGLDPLGYHADPLLVKKEAGVGILFTENTDPYVQRTQVLVKKVYPGGPAQMTGMISEGDMLTDVNGEDVTGKTLAELRTTIPGAPDTPIQMGFISRETGQYYEVDMLRSLSGGPEVGKIKNINHNQPKGGSPPPPDKDTKPQIGEATVGFSIVRDEQGGAMRIANITHGSNAQQNGFESDEVLERIDNKNIEMWEDESIKFALSGPFSTLVQIQTNKRTVPVTRDCATYEPPPIQQVAVQEFTHPIQMMQQYSAPPPPVPQPVFQQFEPMPAPMFEFVEPTYRTIAQPQMVTQPVMQPMMMMQSSPMMMMGPGPTMMAGERMTMNDGYY